MVGKKKHLDLVSAGEHKLLSCQHSSSEESRESEDSSTPSIKDKNKLQSIGKKSVHSASVSKYSSSKSKFSKRQYSPQDNGDCKGRTSTSVDSLSSSESEESSSSEDKSKSSTVSIKHKRKIHSERKKSAHENSSSSRSISRSNSKQRSSLQSDSFKKKHKSLNSASEELPFSKSILPGYLKSKTPQRMKHAQDLLNQASENESSINEVSRSRPLTSPTSLAKRKPASPGDSKQKRRKTTSISSVSSSEQSSSSEDSCSTLSKKEKKKQQSIQTKLAHSKSLQTYSISKSGLPKMQYSVQEDSNCKGRKHISIDSMSSTEESSSSKGNSNRFKVQSTKKISVHKVYSSSQSISHYRSSKQIFSSQDADNFKLSNSVSEAMPSESNSLSSSSKIGSPQEMKYTQVISNQASENESFVGKSSYSMPPTPSSRSTKRRPSSPEDNKQKRPKTASINSVSSSSSEQSSSSDDITLSNKMKNKLQRVRKKHVHRKSFPSYSASKSGLPKKRHSLEEDCDYKRRKNISIDSVSSAEESSSLEDDNSRFTVLNKHASKTHSKEKKSIHNLSSSQSASHSRSSKQICSSQADNYQKKQNKTSNSVSEMLPSKSNVMASSLKSGSPQEMKLKDLSNQAPENEFSVQKASHSHLSTSPSRSTKRKHSSPDDSKHKRRTTVSAAPVSGALSPNSITASDLSSESKSHSFSEYSNSHKICSLVTTPKHLSQSFLRTKYLKSSADQTPYSPLVRYTSWKSKQHLPPYDIRELGDRFKVGFIDSHCHLDFLFKRAEHRGSFEKYREMLKEYFPASYEGCVAVFCDPATFEQVSLWEPLLEEDGVWGAFGCHPHNAAAYSTDIEKALLKALFHRKVKALGEIGLDYSTRNNCDRKVQHKVFEKQLKIAVCCGLPLVIHSRDSDEDCFKIMKELVPVNYRIHLHCFTGGWELAKMWLDGFPNLCIGITNVVTFPSATSVHTTVKNIPLDRLLLETDTPYFLPRILPRSLRWSHPGMAIHVAAQICAIKQTVSLEELLIAVRSNTKRIYKI